MSVDNEYVKDKTTGEVTKISDVGGDEIDIVYDGTVNEDGSVTVDAESAEVIDVETTSSSGIDTRYTQDENATPGERNIHGSIPLDVKAYAFLANFFSGGTAGTTLGIVNKGNKVRKAAKRGKASTKNIKKINQARKNSWVQKEKDLIQAKRNAGTKAEKKAIQKQIDHARRKQRSSENHTQKGKGN